jgi:serine/threonine-protein kinase PRP4
VIRAANNPALTDNWDDAEGYYKIVLGEKIIDRYHVFANLGKGVFSSVVKAKDDKSNNMDVAIKVKFNDEVMFFLML